MVPDGVKSPAHNSFQSHDRESLQALLKPVSQVRILPGHSLLMQVSGGFQVPADWCWLVLVGAVVGDGLASDDAPWLAIVNVVECSECKKEALAP